MDFLSWLYETMCDDLADTMQVRARVLMNRLQDQSKFTGEQALCLLSTPIMNGPEFLLSLVSGLHHLLGDGLEFRPFPGGDKIHAKIGHFTKRVATAARTRSKLMSGPAHKPQRYRTL